MNVAVRAGAPAQQRLFESMLATEIAKRIIGDRATVTFKESDRPASLVDRGDADLALTSSTELPPAGVVFSDPYARGFVVAYMFARLRVSQTSSPTTRPCSAYQSR